MEEKKPNYWVFPKRFKDVRCDRGINPNALADKIGTSRSTIVSWENGNAPRLDLLTKAADILDVSLDYLVGRTNYEKINILGDEERFEKTLSQFTGEDIVFLWKMFQVKFAEISKRNKEDNNK